MLKIATPQELQAEIRAIMAFVQHSEKPDRQVVADKLNELADRVIAGAKASYDRTAAIEVPKELIDAMKPSVRKMESILQSKAHKKFESIHGLETDYASNGELIVNFWGPKRKGRRSPVEEEPSGRYFVYLKMASDSTVDIEVKRMPWKKGGIDLRGGPKVNKKGVSFGDAASTTEKLLTQVAGK